MNFLRILGQNNKIYQKFGDYCVTEALPNQSCIVCCFCQEQHNAEETFWAHMLEVHEYSAPSLLAMKTKSSTVNCLTLNSYGSSPTTTSDTSGCGSGTNSIYSLNTQQQHCNQQSSPSSISVATPTALPKSAAVSPLYVEAEYLEGVSLNDPSTLLELGDMTSTFFDFTGEQQNQKKEAMNVSNSDESSCAPLTYHDEASSVLLTNGDNSIHSTTINDILKTHIDIDELAPKQFCENGKLLKRLFQQLQRSNNEFKYKINKLAQSLQLIEEELKNQNVRVRKHYMKIIPDQPFNTRDEVLILDDELHHSKEMRDALHDEASAIVAENAEVYCRVLWRFIMTNEVSNQFCWRGVVYGDKVIKYPVKDMTMMDVFLGVFREKFPSQPLNYFKERTMTYFNKAHDRLKRKQLSKVESAENNNCDFSCDNEYERKTTTLISKKRTKQATERKRSIDSVFEEVFC